VLNPAGTVSVQVLVGRKTKTMMSHAALPVAPVGVWVQLFVGEKKQGESFEIEQTPRNVNALKKAVKEEWTVSLQHCDAAMLNVFAPGADPKTDDTLDPGDPVSGDTSSKNPLIVVAPKHHQQPPQDGELSCCSRILVFQVFFAHKCYHLVSNVCPFHHLLQSQCYSNQQFSMVPYRKWCGKQRPWNMGSLPCCSKLVCHPLPFQNQRTTSL
jgi:hypothetical protein